MLVRLPVRSRGFNMLFLTFGATFITVGVAALAYLLFENGRAMHASSIGVGTGIAILIGVWLFVAAGKNLGFYDESRRHRL